MTTPNWVHLSHWDMFVRRRELIVTVAEVLCPDMNEFQRRSLMAHARNQWVRHGGCLCVMGPGAGTGSMLEMWAG